MKTTYERLKEIIEVQLGVHPDQITPEATLRGDLGMDSIDSVELVMAIEEDMVDMLPNGIPDEAIIAANELVETVQDAVDAIDAFSSANVRDHRCSPE